MINNDSSTLFIDEISSMMYTSGDASTPNHDCILLVRQLVQRQLSALIEAADTIATRRVSRQIIIDDILYLMRNNRSLMRRLIAHVRARDRVTTVRSSTKNDDDDESNTTIVGDDDIIGGAAIHDGNRTRQLRDAICRFDSTGEIGTLFDDDSVDSVKRNRLERMVERVRRMDDREHIRFSDARRITLAYRNTGNNRTGMSVFRDWLTPRTGVINTISNDVIDILNFIASEIVCTIVETACNLRNESSLSIDYTNTSRPLHIDNYREALRRFDQHRLISGRLII